ncbi:LuxR C-terminal-related transcriptional regulator [Streptomyces violascens]|uniref:HTH luxR-type domain-containing protein n=1 Tax=Streptomyces violascens TaxID=67381 RepID=A0ABQ3QGJ2_9ACTN|nr:hypothetical protein GCM10010289_07250 [Streptomyces violascens]GHI36390.1 hypothetical protein Sviol_07980 [Streptomyces violascens]
MAPTSPARDVAIVAFAQSDHRRRTDELSEVELLMPVLHEVLDATGLKTSDIGFTCSGSSDYLAGRAFSFTMALDGVGAWPPISESHVEMDGAWALYEAWVKILTGEADGILIEILLARGRIQEAQELSDTYNYGQVVPGAVVYPDSETVYSELLIARGLRTDAEERLRAVGRRLEPRGMRNPMWCPWRPLLAQTIAHTDPGEAADIAQEAVEIARRFGTPGAIGRALHAAAKVASGADSLALMAEAVRQLERSPAAYELAQALVDHGAMLSRAGLPQDAADLLMRGLESAALCGADALAARAREELAASGLRPLQLRTVDSDSLTSQEKAVAERAAQGWENKRIAEELSIKERTVELLLSGAFRKLGTDRSGLAGLLPHQTRGSGIRGVPPGR